MSTQRPPGSTMMFDGFTSRWISPIRCASARPSASDAASSTARAAAAASDEDFRGERAACARASSSTRSSVGPSMNSME